MVATATATRTNVCGVVFELDTSGEGDGCPSFPKAGSGGAFRLGELIVDAEGNVYEPPSMAATACPAREDGVSELECQRKGYGSAHLTGKQGKHPLSGVLRDSAGNLYGAVNQGGDFGCGTVFELSVTAEKITILHSFAAATEIVASSGFANRPWMRPGICMDPPASAEISPVRPATPTRACGVRVSRSSTTGERVGALQFGGGADGSVRREGVVLDTAGNLYGTTVPRRGSHLLLGRRPRAVEESVQSSTRREWRPCSTPSPEGDGGAPRGLTRDSAGTFRHHGPGRRISGSVCPRGHRSRLRRGLQITPWNRVGWGSQDQHLLGHAPLLAVATSP